MSSIRELNYSFFYMLVFTAISSALAYKIVLDGYDTVFFLSMLPATW